MGKQIIQYLNQPKKKAPKSLHSLSIRERKREWEERGGKADRLAASCSKGKLLY